MARTDADMVKAVMLPGKDYDTTAAPSLTRFINMATALTDRVNTCATGRGLTLTTAELLEIETLLAAHFYQASDQGYTSKGTKGASASFHGQTGMRLEGTKYGQAALTLDISGCLGSLGKARARGKWLGRAPSDQTAYEDRD